MQNNKQTALGMIAVASVILVIANMNVWVAAQEELIAPVENLVLWGGVVVLNMVSVLWAISLLGLHPLVVTLSYIVGGILAFKGVEGISGIRAAEITTAGASFGAFGSLVVGHATTKVRMAFFSKRQVPFIFIIWA